MSAEKLCFVIPGDLATRSGGYAYDRRLLELLPGLGVDVAHVPLPAGYPFPDEAAVRESARTLRSLDPDALVMIDGLALGVIPPADLACLNGRLIGLVHHPLALETGLSSAQAAALQASERAALALASHVIVTGTETRRALIADYGVDAGRITVAMPGTVRPPPKPLGRRPGPLRLLAVGAIIARKGYDVLAAALAGLRGLEWRLTIAGSLTAAPQVASDLRLALATHALESRVHLAGAVSDAGLAALYREADLFVMPSLYEGYGMVAAEALAHGLPMVATTGGALATTIPDAAALKVPPGDRHALREALARALEDESLRENLAQASLRAGAALPTWPDVAALVATSVHHLAAMRRQARS